MMTKFPSSKQDMRNSDDFNHESSMHSVAGKMREMTFNRRICRYLKLTLCSSVSSVKV